MLDLRHNRLSQGILILLRRQPLLRYLRILALTGDPAISKAPEAAHALLWEATPSGPRPRRESWLERLTHLEL